MHGGVKVYRGAASAARAYVEADRSRADDYYLGEGTGVARRFGASPHGGVEDICELDGDSYERWVAGCDPTTGSPRGRLRHDPNAVRFVEITVNGPKTWSLAASLHPEIAAAYDVAQDRAAEQIIGWVAEHATTRVGPRGRQVQVPVERIEAVTVRHYTSRAGDPHRHLHLQINARIFAEGKWRGLHTVGFRDSIEALNGIGHAAMMTDPEFRAALAAAGFTLNPESGEIRELAPYAGRFSARTAQIGRNIDRYEAEWRADHPGQEPGPKLCQAWDRRAWKEARPDKVVPVDGAELVQRWNDELRSLRYRDPTPQPGLPLVVDAPRPGSLGRSAAVETVLTRLGARRSAWNHADVRGEAEKWIAATGLIAPAPVRIEMAEDITARVIEVCVPLLEGASVPEHIRAWTSADVLAVEADIVRLIGRATSPSQPTTLRKGEGKGLDVAQRDAVAALAGNAEVLVVEGAAGAGKTTTLTATAQLLAAQGRRLCVVTPTLKAAQVAGRELGASATSAAWLVHQHGFRWDDDGRWTRCSARPAPEAVLTRGDLLLIDEAGMLDQDTARALLTIADETGARVALVGDRHQLPAVGRGGVLDLAVRWAGPGAITSLDVVHRFSDPEYAAISLAMRAGTSLRAARCEALSERVSLTGADRYQVFAGSVPLGEASGERVGEVFDALWARDQIRIYASEAERNQALARLATDALLAGTDGVLLMADTREQTTALNGAIRDRLVAAGHVDDTRVTVTHAGERLGIGDRVATRRNDRDLGVANRDTWTISTIGDDGSLALQGRRGARVVPAAYARHEVELAYATTVYGAQGGTTCEGHVALGEHTTASSAYVGMTRGRETNLAHLVATNIDDARRQWDEVFSRDRADLGPAHAARRAASDVERYASHRPLDVALAELRAAWTKEDQLRGAVRRATQRRNMVAYYGPETAERVAEIDAEIAEYRGLLEPPAIRCAFGSTSPRSGASHPAVSNKSTAPGHRTATTPPWPPVLSAEPARNPAAASSNPPTDSPRAPDRGSAYERPRCRSRRKAPSDQEGVGSAHRP